MENKNYYEVLEIDKNASEYEIKKAYKQLAKRYHPDLNKNKNAKDKFIEIHKAYTELLNPKIDNQFNIFGLERWEDIVKIEDFNIPPIDYIELSKAEKERDRLKKIFDTEGKILENELIREFEELYGKEFYASSRNDRNFYKELSELEPFTNYLNACKKCKKIKYGRFKEYNWAVNKIRLLNKLYRNSGIFNHIKGRDKLNFEKIIGYLQRVLNKEVDVKEKIPKTKLMTTYKSHREAISKSYEDGKNYDLQKLEFDIMNQFHPKFLNKFPTKIQIFIHNKIKDLIKHIF
jgi:curved DNA-binding protein CbpA